MYKKVYSLCFFLIFSQLSGTNDLQNQFDKLYSDNITLSSVKNTADGKFNKLAINRSPTNYVFLSKILDFYFDKASHGYKKNKFILNENNVYVGGYNSHDNIVDPKPDNIITMLDLLFLRLVINEEKLEEMQNFQKMLLRMDNNEQITVDDDKYNFNKYVAAASIFLDRLIIYIEHCPQVTSSSRHKNRDIAFNTIQEIKNNLSSDNATDATKLEALKSIGFIVGVSTAEYEIKQFNDRRSKWTSFSPKHCKTHNNFTNTKNYLSAIDHTEVMYYVLCRSGYFGAITPRIIISGKCPCPDCDKFITCNNPEFNNEVFNKSKMIGYNYGWATRTKPEEAKKNYKLSCKQIVNPKKGATTDWDNNVHAAHMGTTPINNDNETNFKTYVIGPSYSGTPAITENNCTSKEDGRGPCIINGMVDASNQEIIFDQLN